MKAWLKRVFIPHEENGYAPHSLQKVALGGMLMLILLSFTLANIQSIIWVTSDWMVSTILPAVVVQDTNDERATESLGSLRRNATLDTAAQLKANDMAKYSYFAHTSPAGVTPWYWFAQAGYNYVHAGENLAVHFTDSDEVVKAWMNSPTHRANIMNGNYTEIGIGTAEGTYEGFPTVFVVQLFGTPAALPKVAGDAVNTTKPAPAVEKVAVNEPVTESNQPSSTSPTTTVLANSFDIEEKVEIVPAKPVPVTTNSLAPSSTPTTTNVENIDVTEHGVVAYSDFISTSTGGVPATIDTNTPLQTDKVPFFARVATQPHLFLQILYLFIAVFVLISLALSVVIEVRHQQPLQIAYSLALLMVMFGLFYIHTILTTGIIIV